MTKSKLSLLIIGLIVATVGIVLLGWLMQRNGTPKTDEKSANSTTQRCLNQQQAFAIDARFQAQVNKQTAYQSKLLFNLQLNPKGKQIQGIAHNIRLFLASEKQPKKLPDMTFLSQVDATNTTLFSHFDSLGLAKQHPMLVVAQVLKNLSFSKTQQPYQFRYDLMQGNYQYQKQNGQWHRYNLAGNTPKQTQNWRIHTQNDCSILSMQAQESRPLTFANVQGQITYTIRASQSQNIIDPSHFTFAPNSNAGQHFQSSAINAEQFAKQVQSAKEMWSIIQRFEKEQDIGRLMRAAEFMVTHVSTYELAQHLQNKLLSEDEKRNLAFGLGLAQHAQAGQYILQTIKQIPAQAGDQVDVQKVRLMVALAGRKPETREEFDGLMALSDSTKESNNVKNNALISAAMLAKNIEQQGTGSVKQELADKLQEHIKNNSQQASSSMLAANNAGIDSLDEDIIPQLKSSQANRRYGAATVLANRPQHYDLLITHLQTEADNRINQVIVERIKKEQLSAQQKQQLAQIVKQAKQQPQEYQKDKAQLIATLLTDP